jgi:glutamate-ammonia-ligase adenylyltransferase
VRALAGDGVPDALFERLLAPLLDALAASADPDRAATNFGRWAERLHARRSHFEFLAAHPPAVRALAAVFAGSQYFSNVLIGQPEYAEAVTNVRLRGAPGAKSFEAFFRDAGRAVDVFAGPGGKRAALRRFKALEMLRIGARDLTGAADTATITREISHFADAAVQKAYEFCAREACDKHGLAATPPFAVIAMGKLGGGELNYSSDIDLLFVHGDEPPGVVPADYHQGVARSLVAALSEATTDGFVFRVDMRLRPEGRFGPLSRSLGSCRAYYESWAEPWERQALLKARPVAGDPALGAAFLRVVQPFVWARGGGGGAAAGDIVAALRENKRRIETRMQMAGTWRTSVKEGYGGIRDVEWTVQALQLALGGAHPVLRNARGTAAALRGLAQLGILSEEDRQTLEEGYWFLRAVEHRLQILDELPVRDLPARPEERRRLARRLGFATVDAFDARYREVTEAVRARYERLVGGETAAPAPGAPDGAPGVGGGRWRGRICWRCRTTRRRARAPWKGCGRAVLLTPSGRCACSASPSSARNRAGRRRARGNGSPGSRTPSSFRARAPPTRTPRSGVSRRSPRRRRAGRRCTRPGPTAGRPGWRACACSPRARRPSCRPSRSTSNSSTCFSTTTR